MDDSNLIVWVISRLVKDFGEHPNAEYILKLNEIAKRLRTEGNVAWKIEKVKANFEAIIKHMEVAYSGIRMSTVEAIAKKGLEDLK